ncbi:hypothetical protein [Enterobacter cloacae]|uniref:hypothetical protein n=1 Tax=Enterobacter cloacae TaxID=550 RepID=UPI00300E8FEF
MRYQFFLYDKNIFYSQGIKMVITSLLAEQADVLYSLTDDYEQLLVQLQRQVNDEGCMWILCDLDSLPRERLHTLQLMKEFYQQENKSLIILLSKHNMPLFLRCIRFCPLRTGCSKLKIWRASRLFFSGCWIKHVRDVALVHRWSTIRKKNFMTGAWNPRFLEVSGG